MQKRKLLIKYYIVQVIDGYARIKKVVHEGEEVRKHY